ncbi:hypothetical protein [Streptomyces sp. NPDC052610]|uniref:hypothetical protein n=1 Tax=Streptomyces sp. NPDC052610 TaxID=3154952 RepID=UPI00341A3F02
MDERRDEEPGRGAGPVGRDLPDQQVSEEEDPWDVPMGPSGPESTHRTEDDAASADVPDTDEAGTGRRGDQRADTVHPEHPGPEESPA